MYYKKMQQQAGGASLWAFASEGTRGFVRESESSGTVRTTDELQTVLKRERRNG